MPLLTEDDKLALKGFVIDREVGQLLFGEGEMTTETYLILKGHVKVTNGGPDRVVAIRGPGEVVGEMSAVDRHPRSGDVWAIEDIQVKVVRQKEWLEFLYDRPRVFHALAQSLSHRLREATTKQSQMGWFLVERRLAKGLVELSQKLGRTEPAGVVIRGFTQEELAGFVGAKNRNSITPFVRAFRQKGLLHTGNRKFVIPDLDHMRKIAEGSATALEDTE